MFKYFSIVLLSLLILVSCRHDAYPKNLVNKIKPGDLVFENLNCGELCKAINEVTKTNKFTPVNHIAMVESVKNNEITLIEAYTNGVSRIKFNDFVKRAKKKNGIAEIYIARINQPYHWKLKLVIYELKKRLGKPYDFAFLPDNGAYYCSELISDSFASAGLAFFKRFPMFFGKKKSNARKIWLKYFNSKKLIMPENEQGTNPSTLLSSNYLKIIYDYRK